MLERWELDQKALVCGFDIDGVLNNYPQSWLDFVYEQTGKVFLDLNELKSTLSYKEYKDLKYKYRESGYKGLLPASEHAAYTTQYLQNIGYHIVILTSRPFDKHPNLFRQTVDWLEYHEIAYDNLIANENKYVEVLSRYSNLKFFVDDHRYYANMIAKWGYKVFLLDNPYNQGQIEDSVERIQNLKEVIHYGERAKAEAGNL